jgi:hypothetical protein
MNFSPMRAGEKEVFTVDFGPLLAAGETISSPVWSITVVDGCDASANAMIQGSSTLAGSTVSQMIGSGLPGVRYAPKCTVQTSQGETLILPAYGDGLLDVTL